MEKRVRQKIITFGKLQHSISTLKRKKETLHSLFFRLPISLSKIQIFQRDINYSEEAQQAMQ